MPENIPAILALDFDGVICDGLIEYFQTAWRAYCKIWTPADETPPNELAPRFYRLRPVVETGWEMPVLLRVLLLGVSDDEVLQDWVAIAQRQIAEERLNPADLAAAVDGTRDDWIASNLDMWLVQHRFYPGILERLQQIMESPVHLVIITTKEGRFVRQLLQQQGIQLSEQQIFGKEVQKPKYLTLLELIKQFNTNSDKAAQVWFIEDRLKTLRSVEEQAGLEGVRLFLADWGYNTTTERESVRHDPRVHLLSLTEFTQDFSAWLH